MRQFLVNSLFEIAVRARKSPWIETFNAGQMIVTDSVRARKSPWIETNVNRFFNNFCVRARKSPWIETRRNRHRLKVLCQGS